MNQSTRIPNRNTVLSNQMRRILDTQKALRPASSVGTYTTATVNGVFRRPKAKATEEGSSTSAYYA